jgi:hypothetical protein
MIPALTIYRFRLPGSFIGLVTILMLAAVPSMFAAPVTIWSGSSTPALISDPDTSPNELGFKFRSTINGFITGIRFYKGPLNTGSHVGSLWSSNGTKLASVPFIGESASGWQQQSFTNPVPITANATYIASYFCPNGRYSIDESYFAGSISNFPLVALQSGISGSNGVFRSGPTGFPTDSYLRSHYWVDVVFAVSIGTDTNKPVLTSISPPPGTYSNLTSVSVTFSKYVNGVGANDLLVNGVGADTVIGSGSNYTFYFPQPAYGTVNLTWLPAHGISDLASPPNAFDATAPGATWSYTLSDLTPPTIQSLLPPPGSAISSLTQIEVTFSEPVLGLTAADLLVNGQPATNLIQQGVQSYLFAFAQPATGLVSLAWAPTHGITDVAAVPNPFAGGSWNYTLDPNLPPYDILINEVLSANVNGTGLLDEDGELEDWIEIWNRGTAPINLQNWSLSDDEEIPGLWTFPDRTIAPGAYLIVFASGKDRKPTATNQNLHTNFRLASAGEHLGLYSPGSPRQLISGFSAFPEQRNDISFGPDNTNALRYFSIPTPGAPNGFSTIVAVVGEVHANVKRGFFDAPFTLILSCPTDGATIRYTTNGSEPGPTSSVFPASLIVSNTFLLRAAAFKTNHLPSRTGTHSYLFNVAASNRSLPAISIVIPSNNLYGATGIWGIQGGSFTGTDGLWVSNGPTDYHNPSKRGEQWERPASVEWIDPADHSGFQEDCGIRISGSDYRRPRIQPTTKVSFRLYFRGDYGDTSLKYPLFPLTPVEDHDGLVLRGGFDDENNPFVRDETIRRLSHDMGQVASHGTLGILFVNGAPRANSPYYNPVERINDDFCQTYFGGGESWDVISQISASGSVVDGVRNNFEALVAYMDANDASDETVYTNITAWLDVTNFADYLILNTWAVVDDWPQNNWRAAREQGDGKKWRFILWDAEYGMGLDAPQYGTSLSVNNNPFNSTLPTGGGLLNGSEVARMYQELTASPEFLLLWADRVQKHFFNGGALTRANVTNRQEELRRQLLPFLPSMNTEFLNWARDRESIYFSQMQTEGLLASKTAPIFSQHGGPIPPGFTLAMSHTNSGGNTIYFTTNGTDPRAAFTGNVAASATAYAAPVAINSSMTVKARILSGNNWSALTEATFTFASLGNPVRITELMYNPPGGSLYEFIELANPSAAAVNLSGCYFDGITFIFPQGSMINPGQRLVLGSNTDTNAWKVRYPSVSAAGWFSGNLNNTSERIEFRDPNGTLITAVDYSDSGGWPDAADGLGMSLELIDVNAPPDAPANWQSSATTNGTPGVTNSLAFTSVVVLNEVMADNVTAVSNAGTFPDWIELRNLAGTNVPLANWSLSDDGNKRKFVFPGGTNIPANGHLIIWCDAATNTTPGLHAGFALSKNGETISLYNAATNRVDSLTLGLQITDYSVGRISNSWALNVPTPNGTNVPATLAATTNLSINEWLANALPGQPDWVELFNRSSSHPVSLSGIYLATSNNLDRLTWLSFLPPNGHVQLFADSGIGPDHLEFSLSASGDRIRLHDASAVQVEQIVFTNQLEGISAGRLPSGGAVIASFPGSSSPGASNYVSTYSGPVWNEILARNATVLIGGRIADFVELRNPGAGTFDLSGMSFSVDEPDFGRWTFPPGTTLAAGDHLLITCDSSLPDSTNSGSFNVSESLNGSSGGAYLFNSSGQLVSSLLYGLQVQDLSIGVTGGQWKLLSAPTPGLANASAAPLSTNTVLRINEWMADPDGGIDWFELFNPAVQPVDLATISLSDDPSIIGRNLFLPAPLSFIAPKNYVQWFADANPDAGLDHVNFGLDQKGDTLLLYSRVGTNFALVDAIAFGWQTNGVSSGRLLDGAASIYAFPGTETPGESNYRLLTSVRVNEILTHTDPPLEDAVELYNPGSAALNVGRWYVSNNRDNFKKYQFAPGTSITTNGYLVLYENAFNNGSTNGFTLNSANGDEVWISAADGSGVETGERLVIDFGAAFNGISFGRIQTSEGVDYAPLTHHTFGVTNPATLTQFRTGTGGVNAGPRVGPVVVNEINYNPGTSTNAGYEFIELHNAGSSPVPLFHPTYPTNTWRVADAVDYSFPTNVTMAPGSYLLIVNFDPATNTTALLDFRADYGISSNVPVFGPFVGGLNNTADDVELLQPDNVQQPPSPDAGFTPYVRVDRVHYRSTAPWPSLLANGNGNSLQRVAPTLYGNEALNWSESAPTPGSSNIAGNGDTDGDGIPDAAELAMGLNPNDPADAALDGDGDGASNYEEYVAGTSHTDPQSRFELSAIPFGDKIVLSFMSVSNKTYSVLYQETSTGTNWTKLVDLPSQPATQVVYVTNATAHATRFFRATTPALP